MSKTETVEDRVRRIVSERLGVDEADVVKDADLETDLGADYPALLEIHLAIEEEFDISIPDDQLEKLKTVTVGQLVDYVERMR